MDQSIWGLVLIGVVIVGALFLASSDIRIPGTLFVPLAAAIPMLMGYKRAKNLPVFALYENAFELTANMYATPIRIQYSDILGVKIKRNAAKLEVRRPDGSIDKKLTVAFSFIAGSEREEAKRIFEKKMRDLGLVK